MSEKKTGSSTLKEIDANLKVIASIVATLVIISGSLVAIWATFRGDEEPTPTPVVTQQSQATATTALTTVADTPTETPTTADSPEPTATESSQPTDNSPIQLKAPADGETVHNSGQSVRFEWTGNLEANQKYVLIIYHWNKDCTDVQCTDVTEIGIGNSFELPANQFFLWESEKATDKKNWDVEWAVWIVDDKTRIDPEKLPSTRFIVAQSKPRPIVIEP